MVESMNPNNPPTPQDGLLKLAERLFAVLRDFPANGQLRHIDQDTLTDLLLAGFIERQEVTKPCRTCGTPRFDYGFFRITGGGRVFMATAEAALKARASQ